MRREALLSRHNPGAGACPRVQVWLGVGEGLCPGCPGGARGSTGELCRMKHVGSGRQEPRKQINKPAAQIVNRCRLGQGSLLLLVPAGAGHRARERDRRGPPTFIHGQAGTASPSQRSPFSSRCPPGGVHCHQGLVLHHEGGLLWASTTQSSGRSAPEVAEACRALSASQCPQSCLQGSTDSAWQGHRSQDGRLVESLDLTAGVGRKRGTRLFLFCGPGDLTQG